MKKYAIIIVLALLMFPLLASNLEETLESLSGAAAREYVKPMVTAFGSDMNAGWFHKAPRAAAFAWDLEFGIVLMGTLFTSNDKEFDVLGSFNFTRDQAERLAVEYQSMPYYNEMVNQIVSQSFEVHIMGPTITGPAYDEVTNENPIIILFPNQEITFQYEGETITRPLPQQSVLLKVGGLLEDLPLMPLAAPQLSIGTVYGTMLSVRYLPDVELTPEIGKVKYMGFGIQHNPQAYLPFTIPVNVALAFYNQTLDIGDIVKSSAMIYGLNISKTWGIKLVNITPYAGFSIEKSKMEFSYEYLTGVVGEPDVPESIKIKFDAEGKNTSRITTGLSFRIGLININMDYNIARYPSASTGVGFNFSW